MFRHRLQGAVLFAGGVLLLVLDPELHWVPFALGASYLAAALLGGRRGSYWSTALILTGWGLGALAIFELEVDLTQASTYLMGVGAGGLVGALLADRGFAITATALTAMILGAGIVYSLQPHVEAIEEPVTYGIALAAVGALRLAVGRRVQPG